MSELQEEQTGVNLVQEVSKGGHGQPPLPYVLREEDRPTGDQPLASDVPVIDISRLFKNQSGSHDDEAEKLRSALQSWGLFQVSFQFYFFNFVIMFSYNFCSGLCSKMKMVFSSNPI